jgi:RNA polymerase sigma-70 factor (ECF subfamily)
MAPLQLTDEALERVEALATADASAALIRDGLAALPADQRDAVVARVLEEQEYAEMATNARTSESVVRKRVSRGLAGLRSRLESS